MEKLTDTEIRILNRVQKDWKLGATPFAYLSDELGISEDTLITAIEKLKRGKIIRDISAIFNAASMGYKSALVALEVPEDCIGKAVSAINANTGVSHNYLRDHKYNIWFTLSVAKDRSLDEEAKALADKSEAKDFLVLRNERLLKIGVNFHFGENEDNTEAPGNVNIKNVPVRELSQQEKLAVNILQMDLPLTNRPFRELIQKSNSDIEESRVVALGEAFKKEGIMRRYSAIVKHAGAGYRFNAMTAWKLADYGDDVLIKKFASVPDISHLYLRTIYPGRWEHGLFAMIHAKSKDELDAIIVRLETQTGIKDYLVLNTVRELKKQRVMYFI
ncbi:MAG: Lrp/AsnC family transcriptional regulator [Spirochaetota bacterium]